MFSRTPLHAATAPPATALRFIPPLAANADATGRLVFRRMFAPTTTIPAGRAMSLFGSQEDAACAVKVQGGHIMDVENARTLAMQVGTVIATRRKKMGLTQVQLATRLGITQDSLSRMENGAIAPKFSRLPELAASLDCAVVDLFRQPTRQTRIMADAVADELSSLPPEMQALVLRMVRDTSRTLRKLSKK